MKFSTLYRLLVKKDAFDYRIIIVHGSVLYDYRADIEAIHIDHKRKIVEIYPKYANADVPAAVTADREIYGVVKGKLVRDRG